MQTVNLNDNLHDYAVSGRLRGPRPEGLRKLRDACDGDLRFGVVLYDGKGIVPFGDRMFAALMPCAWS
jgi:hypothetical protein